MLRELRASAAGAAEAARRELALLSGDVARAQGAAAAARPEEGA
jgi:hypothetical protein